MNHLEGRTILRRGTDKNLVQALNGLEKKLLVLPRIRENRRQGMGWFAAGILAHRDRLDNVGLN